MTPIPALVRFALATHLRKRLDAIHDADSLTADLALTPLDLVWVAMRVEALENGDGEFPIDDLRDVKTVGDLVGAFEAWAERRDGAAMDLCAE